MPTPTDVEALAGLGSRLLQHAETLRSVPVDAIVHDMRLAMQATDRLAGLRLRVAEIADDAVAVSLEIAEALRAALAEDE